MDYKKMTIDDIIEYCQKNGEVEWLKSIAQPPATYFQIKKAFCLKFMPEIMPKKKEKKPTMYERIKGL